MKPCEILRVAQGGRQRTTPRDTTKPPSRQLGNLDRIALLTANYLEPCTVKNNNAHQWQQKDIDALRNGRGFAFSDGSHEIALTKGIPKTMKAGMNMLRADCSRCSADFGDWCREVRRETREVPADKWEDFLHWQSQQQGATASTQSQP